MENTQCAVENEVVLRDVDRAIFWFLTMLNSGAMIWLASAWISALDWTSHPFLLSGMTGIGAILLSLNQANWFILLYMKRPRWIPPREGWRVAVVTTIVPPLESVDMLEATLEALVGLEYPHDTWVLDEDNDPRVRRLCERLGVKHFSGKKSPHYQSEQGTSRDYVVTPKTGPTSPKHILLFPNAVGIAAVTAASIIGTFGDHAGSSSLCGVYSVAGLTIVGSLALIATEYIKFPGPYDTARSPTFDL